MQLTPEERQRIIERELARVTAQRQAKSKTRLKYVVWACLGCFGLLVVIGVAAVLLTVAYPLGQTAVTATATVRPAPTRTRYVPKVVPNPVRSPTPTRTPSPAGFSAAERAYLLKMRSITEPCSEALRAFSLLASLAGNDPVLILDDEWVFGTVMALAAMKVASEEIRGLEPPRRFSSVHKNLEEAAEHLDRAVYLFTKGMDDVDASKIRLAGQEMLLGRAAVERANTQLEAFTR